MKFIDYFSNLAMPLMIIIIVLYGVIERKKVFDIFLDGAKDGIKVVFNIFPTLVGLFVAIGALILDLWLLLLWDLLRLRFILLRCILVLWVLRRQDLFCGLLCLLILLGLLLVLWFVR